MFTVAEPVLSNHSIIIVDHRPEKECKLEKTTKIHYLNAQISVPKLAISSSSSHCAKHVGINFNNFLHRLWCCKNKEGRQWKQIGNASKVQKISLFHGSKFWSDEFSLIKNGKCCENAIRGRQNFKISPETFKVAWNWIIEFIQLRK